MTSQADLELLDALARRFEDDYFIRSLKEYGLFVMPNFVADAADGRLSIRLLDHVTEADEARIKARLAGLSYQIESKRLTLTEIEQQTGIHFPDPGEET